MLIVNRVAEDAGRYYLDGPVVGRWCGAARHDLGLHGEVTREALEAVLAGLDPDDGSPLCRRRTGHRRAGWDLIFTAPKSVSLLGALGPPGTSALVGAAHRRACAEAFIWLEQHAWWARRRGALVATSGSVGARYSHQVNAVGEPHLHTHVLVANVVRSADGQWSAVDGSGLWLNRRALAAVYHLALRQQFLAAGLRPNWSVRPDGAADIADIPRRAVEATSTRRQQVQSRLGGADDPAPLLRIAAQRLTRAQPVPPGSWTQRSLAAGFGPDEARRVIDEARVRATPAPVDPAEAVRLASDVTLWLTERRSTFSVVDVLQALSAIHAEGTTATAADDWARAFVTGSPLAPDGRRTTPLALHRDRELIEAARAAAGDAIMAGDGPVRPDRAAVHRLTTGGHGVEILAWPPAVPDDGGWRVTGGKGGFVAQADALDRARAVWQAAGDTVAVATSSEVAARRWRALAGLDRHLPDVTPPAVLIVDRADRRPTAELTGILAVAARNGTKVVLVQGGTLPARRAPISQGLEWLGDAIGRTVPALEPGPDGPANAVTAGRLEVCAHGRQAVQQVVAVWSQLHRQDATTRMVGLGPAECDELNRRARAVLRSAGILAGSEVDIGGRPFAVGDEVVATRRGVIPAGAPGQVCEVDPKGSVLVQWSGGPTLVDAWGGRHLRHAYAVPPGMLHFDPRPVVVLGEPADLGRHQDRVLAAGIVAPAGPRRDRDRPPEWAEGLSLVATLPVGHDIGELEDRVRRLTATLGSSRPPDPVGDRRLDHDRSWLRETIQIRVDALVRAAEVEPGRLADDGLGPVPSDPSGRQQWRHAARDAVIVAERPLEITTSKFALPHSDRSDRPAPPVRHSPPMVAPGPDQGLAL
jgi:conjugative relaxase-like TrwC/TraI family protein